MNAGIFGLEAKLVSTPAELLGRPVPVPMPDAVVYPVTGAARPLMWFDASDAATVFADPSASVRATLGGLVGRLEDKSGNCRHMSQSTSDARPTFLANAANRMSGIRFSSSTSLGNLFDTKRYLDKELTYILVSIIKATSGGVFLTAGGPSTAGGVRNFGLRSNRLAYGTYNVDTPDSAAVLTTDRISVTGVTVTSNFLVQKWVSGNIIQTTQLSYTNASFSGMYLNGLSGTSFRSAFDFCEALIFGRRLGNDEMRSLMLAMMTKWGL